MLVAKEAAIKPCLVMVLMLVHNALLGRNVPLLKAKGFTEFICSAALINNAL